MPAALGRRQDLLRLERERTANKVELRKHRSLSESVPAPLLHPHRQQSLTSIECTRPGPMSVCKYTGQTIHPHLPNPQQLCR